MTENDLTEFRRLIAKRKGATGTVTNSAAPSASAAAVAVKARLDAGRAKFAAVEAQVRAKAAAAALQPAARATQQPAAAMPAGLSASERRAFTKSQSTMTQVNARTFSDTYLHAAAVHPMSPPAEAAVARAELAARGFIFHPGGITSKSHL